MNKNENVIYQQETITREFILKIEHYQVSKAEKKTESRGLKLINSRTTQQVFKYNPQQHLNGNFSGMTIKIKAKDSLNDPNYVALQIRNRSILFSTLISSPYLKNQVIIRQLIPKKIVNLIDSFLNDDYVYMVKGNPVLRNENFEQKFIEITESMKHPQYLEKGLIISCALVQSFQVIHQEALAILAKELQTSDKGNKQRELDPDLNQGVTLDQKIFIIKQVGDMLRSKFPRNKTCLKSNQDQVQVNNIIEFQDILEPKKVEQLFQWINEQKVLILKVLDPGLQINYRDYLILFVDMSSYAENFVIGRDSLSDIIIDNTLISRENTEIYFRGGNFYVKDGVGNKLSTNGTFAQLQEKFEYIHQENQIKVIFGKNKYKISVTPAQKQIHQKKHDLSAYF